MDIDQLQSVRDRERGTDSLQELRESFYEEATEFVRDLRAERDRAASEAADPFDDPGVSRLTDRIRTAERTLEAIYEKRVGKIVKAATFAAADLPAEVEGMTKEEADLFETLVADIEANRRTVLDAFWDEDAAETTPGDSADSGPEPLGGDDAPEIDTKETTTADADPVRATESARESEGPATRETEEFPPARADASAAPESPDSETMLPDDGDESGAAATSGDDVSETPSESEEGDADDPPRELVRITDDVGPILGVDDREYDLSEDDVVTLPAANARPLVKRGAAERLED